MVMGEGLKGEEASRWSLFSRGGDHRMPAFSHEEDIKTDTWHIEGAYSTTECSHLVSPLPRPHAP
eukprot:scaffold8198_cov73-Isochrysis_galbana.AAC.1